MGRGRLPTHSLLAKVREIRSALGITPKSQEADEESSVESSETDTDGQSQYDDDGQDAEEDVPWDGQQKHS